MSFCGACTSGLSKLRPARQYCAAREGTVLGPLLFLIYINDLPDAVSSHTRLFADDCIMYREIKSPQDSALLQKDIDSLCQWENTWQISFNSAKCYVMHVSHKTKPLTQEYHMNGRALESVSHHLYLGWRSVKTLTGPVTSNKFQAKPIKCLACCAGTSMFAVKR